MRAGNETLLLRALAPHQAPQLPQVRRGGWARRDRPGLALALQVLQLGLLLRKQLGQGLHTWRSVRRRAPRALLR